MIGIMENQDENDEILEIFQEKYQEYYLRLLPSDIRNFPEIRQWPFFKIDIVTLYKNITKYNTYNTENLNKITYKLIDSYIHYCYLITAFYYFYIGPAVIVGSGNFQKFNPNSISLLRGNHYKVFLISVLTENLLDFLHLTLFHKIKDYNKNKWGKIIDRIQNETNQEIISTQDKCILLNFRDKYRTGELHKFSPVRGFTSKKEWNHFEEEMKVLGTLFSNICKFYASNNT